MVVLKLSPYQDDLGFCRVYYNLINENGSKLLYCLQDEGKNYGGVMFYRCSQDGEPEYVVKPDPKKVKFEGRMSGQDETIKNVNEWIDQFESIR